ncbi:MAG: tripartite tricarboxylate transporter substrate binding protein [Proteobacteria bacterium]|nr:tripartite tricarboxylate transporter substrate binding protein [Burkholderiales bacterium]
MPDRIVGAALALGLSLGCGHALAQTWPSKPVRIIVGFSPGGGSDISARVVAPALSELWDVPVLIENRPGAAGNIANEYTTRAAPDGHTLLLCSASHSVLPAREGKKLTYDPIGDFAFAAYFGGVPNVLMVHPSMPVKSLKEFIAFARARPDQINVGSAGVGGTPHMSIELLKLVAGIKVVHVPYKGGSAALADLISGQLESSIGNLAGGLLGAIQSGRVRALGVSSASRTPQLPNVPTFQEQGIGDFDVTAWYGLCAPAKSPPAAVARINADVARLLGAGTPVRKRLEEQGIDVAPPRTPEAFAGMVKAEIVKWTRVVREAKLDWE